MAENNETPPLDESLARMRRLAQNVSAQLASGGLENLADWQLRGVTSAYSNDVPVLLAERDRLRAREAAAMGIIHDLIHMAREPFVCAGCGAEWPLGQQHKPDCAVTRGYAWIDARAPQE